MADAWFLAFNLRPATPTQCPDGYALSPEPLAWPPVCSPESLHTSLWYLLQTPTEGLLGKEDHLSAH